MTFRWTEEQLARFDQKAKEWKKDNGVHTHICKGPPKPPNPKGREFRAHRSRLETDFAVQLRALPYHIAEYKPLDNRRWKLDFAWPERKVAVEVQGSVHRIRDKFQRDIEKRAVLMLAGWRVLEVDSEAITSGLAFEWTEKLLGKR